MNWNRLWKICSIGSKTASSCALRRLPSSAVATRAPPGGATSNHASTKVDEIDKLIQRWFEARERIVKAPLSPIRIISERSCQLLIRHLKAVNEVSAKRAYNLEKQKDSMPDRTANAATGPSICSRSTLLSGNLEFLNDALGFASNHSWTARIPSVALSILSKTQSRWQRGEQEHCHVWYWSEGTSNGIGLYKRASDSMSIASWADLKPYPPFHRSSSVACPIDDE